MSANQREDGAWQSTDGKLNNTEYEAHQHSMSGGYTSDDGFNDMTGMVGAAAVLGIGAVKLAWKFRKPIIITVVVLVSIITAVLLFDKITMKYPRTDTMAAQFELRETAGYNSKSLVIIPGGATVTLTGKAVDGWSPVEYEGINGWIVWKYVDIHDTAAVITDSTILRKSADVSSQSLAVLNKDTVMIHEVNTGLWSFVEIDGIKGYVLNSDIAIKKWSLREQLGK